MRQIPYNNAAATLYFAYPPGWDIDSITGVNITVNNTAGTELLAADATTLFTATTLDAATTVGADNVSLTAVTGATEGRPYYIPSSSSGKSEHLVCRYVDTSGKNVYVERELRAAHASGAAFKGTYCTYDLDTSTVADFTTTGANSQLVIIWTPVGSDDLPIYERAEVAISDYQASDFESRFEMLYPREHQVIKAKTQPMADYYDESREQLRIALRSRGFQMNRAVDQSLLTPALLAHTRYLVTLSGGDKWVGEREAAMGEYVRQFETLCSESLWIDMDQDLIEDADEIDDYSAQQMLGSERAI